MTEFQRFWLDICQGAGLMLAVYVSYYGAVMIRTIAVNRKATRECDRQDVWQAVEKVRYNRPIFWLTVLAMTASLGLASLLASRCFLAMLYALWYMDWSLTQMKRPAKPAEEE